MDRIDYNDLVIVCKAKDKEIERLKSKYENPGQKCHRGHKNILPVSLWDCPMCTELLRKEKEWLIEGILKERGWARFSTYEEERTILINNMQQALKEGK